MLNDPNPEYASMMADIRHEMLAPARRRDAVGVALCRDCGRTVTLAVDAVKGGRIILDEERGGRWTLDGGLAKFVGDGAGTHIEHVTVCRKRVELEARAGRLERGMAALSERLWRAESGALAL